MNIERNEQEESTGRPRRHRRFKRSLAATTTIVAVVGAGGVAWATWTNTASGSAAAGGGTLSLTVVSAGSTFTNKLFPGSLAGQASGATEGGDLVLNVTNPQSFPVKITGVTQAGPVTVSGGSGSPACTSDTGTAPNISTLGNSGVYISGTAPVVGSPTTYTSYTLSSPVSVSANATNAAVTLPNVVTMTSSSANGCQGATFTMPVTLQISM